MKGQPNSKPSRLETMLSLLRMGFEMHQVPYLMNLNKDEWVILKMEYDALPLEM